MTIEQLHNRLTELNIPPDRYYLHGLFGSTDDTDKLALSIMMIDNILKYEVYTKERGITHPKRTFTSENEACAYLFDSIKDCWTIEQIYKIEGFFSMTVNERLYVTGRMDDFDDCRSKDKIRARQILRLLAVDETSIDEILK